VDEREVSARDAVMGIAASGTTPYVRGALRRAKERGAATIFFTCNPGVQAPIAADVEIRTLVGPEVVTGSTRMKAGTATKLVLNTITTGAMIRMGRVYENLMVDLRATNEKLRDRARRILAAVTGMDAAQAQPLLDAADGRVKTAIVMHALRVDRTEAERRLAAYDGSVRRAIALSRSGAEGGRSARGRIGS
jgi:N-acetylmuramic acid 6-phosphate etherase